MSKWPKGPAGEGEKKDVPRGSSGSRILQGTAQESRETAATPEEMEMTDVCPFLGFAHAIITRKASAQELLNGAAPLISNLGAGFSPCLKDKCALWHAERKECSIKAGINALIEMNSRAAFRGSAVSVPAVDTTMAEAAKG